MSVETNFRSFIQNVASAYTLCHLKNCFFLLYVYFKIVAHKRVVFPINWNIEKNTTLNTEGLKRGSKKIIWKSHRSSILLIFPNRYLPVQNQQYKQKGILWDMSKVNKKGTRSNVWNKIFTNVLIFYYFCFSPRFGSTISIAILCHFYCYT